MVTPRILLVLGISLAASVGCATVAVYEPEKTAEISLSGPNSVLRTTADEYCEHTRERGLARGESTLGGLAGVFLGKNDQAGVYWSRIDQNAKSPGEAAGLVRSDLASVASGLDELNRLAGQLMEDGQPTRRDVNQFERALIHARQARESLSDAIGHLPTRQAVTGSLSGGLSQVDEAIARAVATADRLAEARLYESIAALPATALSAS